mmetsp:Transcript_7203/g.17504  ORF Transcript_7203/g.17504 Transcript_7203/m.17504 type:complete len:131 (+) Transcript_7203:400-792(+)
MTSQLSHQIRDVQREVREAEESVGRIMRSRRETHNVTSQSALVDDLLHDGRSAFDVPPPPPPRQPLLGRAALLSSYSGPFNEPAPPPPDRSPLRTLRHASPTGRLGNAIHRSASPTFGRPYASTRNMFLA